VETSDNDPYSKYWCHLSQYPLLYRDLANYGLTQGNMGDAEDEDQEILGELAAHNEDIDKEEDIGRGGTSTLNKDRYLRSPLQLHKINTRAGMRLRRLRSDGSKNMRLRRLRRADGSMEANGLPMYVVKRPNYLTTLRSAFDEIMSISICTVAGDEIMSNSICTVAGRLVPCIREPST
jgi:hypothetical protein